MDAPAEPLQVRRTFTVAMSVGNRVHSVTNPDADLVARIAEQWTRANPNRRVHVFVNEFVD